MKGTDAVLALLQDIKDLLYGLVLLILGTTLCIVGAILSPEMALGGFLILIGAGTCICALLYVRHGHTHHEMIEHQDD